LIAVRENAEVASGDLVAPWTTRDVRDWVEVTDRGRKEREEGEIVLVLWRIGAKPLARGT
jgi:hypothetical protein